MYQNLQQKYTTKCKALNTPAAGSPLSAPGTENLDVFFESYKSLVTKNNECITLEKGNPHRKQRPLERKTCTKLKCTAMQHVHSPGSRYIQTNTY